MNVGPTAPSIIPRSPTPCFHGNYSYKDGVALSSEGNLQAVGEQTALAELSLIGRQLLVISVALFGQIVSASFLLK